MNSIDKVLIAFICVAISLIVSCSKEEVEILPEEKISESSLDNKIKILPKSNVTAQRAAISYKGQLCGEVITAVHANAHSIMNSSLWDYYYFNGNAGDEISIYIPRISASMDPAFSLFEGTTNDNTGVGIMSGGENMNFLEFKDDEVPSQFDSCWKDSELLNYVLPNTAIYTLAVFDFLSCGETLTYEIHTTGISCDADADGCMDSIDPHPNSDKDATVIINGCDSGVTNVFVTACSTMSDLIADCANNAMNHGDFVSCVAQLTNEWKTIGLINGKEKGQIQSCAGQSKIP